MPLNVYKKDSHHCTSCLKSADSLALCRCCWRGCRVSSMRRRKNLPPRIAWHAQFSEPAKLCSCCLLARLRAPKCWSCCWSCWSLSLPKDGVLLVVSISTPRKVMRWLVPTTFYQLIKNPSFLKSLIRMSIHFLHSS